MMSCGRSIHSTGIILRHLLRQRVSVLWLQMLGGRKVLRRKRPRIAMSLWWHHAALVERLRSNAGRKLCPAWVLVTGMWHAGSLAGWIEGRCGILRWKVVAWNKRLHSRYTPSWLWWNARHWWLVPQAQQLFGYCQLQLLISPKHNTWHSTINSEIYDSIFLTLSNISVTDADLISSDIYTISHTEWHDKQQCIWHVAQ